MTLLWLETQLKIKCSPSSWPFPKEQCPWSAGDGAVRRLTALLLAVPQKPVPGGKGSGTAGEEGSEQDAGRAD